MSIGSQQTHWQRQAIVSKVGPQVDSLPPAVHLSDSRPSHLLIRRCQATAQQAAELSCCRGKSSRAIVLWYVKQRFRQATV